MTPYYQAGGITIYNCDCREIIPGLEPVGLVVTDPPFSEETHDRARSNRDETKRSINFPPITAAEIEAIFASFGPLCERWLISFLDWRHIAKLEKTTPEPWEFVRFGVFLKTNPCPQMTGDRPANGWDGILYLHNKRTKKRWNGGGHHGNWVGPLVTDGKHPTGKPLALLHQLVDRFSEPGDTVFDPFMGSGTALRAAKDLGRKAIGCDISEVYCEDTAKRLEQEVFAF